MRRIDVGVLVLDQPWPPRAADASVSFMERLATHAPGHQRVLANGSSSAGQLLRFPGSYLVLKTDCQPTTSLPGICVQPDLSNESHAISWRLLVRRRRLGQHESEAAGSRHFQHGNGCVVNLLQNL